MAKQEVCPGCSRHCPMNRLHCKYGQKYFEKKYPVQETSPACAKKKDSEKHPRKWEKHVTAGGLAWRLLWVSCRCKRALSKKQLTEQQLLAVLDEAQQAQLDDLLRKLSGVFE